MANKTLKALLQAGEFIAAPGVFDLVSNAIRRSVSPFSSPVAVGLHRGSIGWTGISMTRASTTAG